MKYWGKWISWVVAVCVLAGAMVPGLCAGEIHEAAKDGDLERLSELLDDDSGLLYEMCEQGKTPLHWATGRGQHRAMELLLTGYDADVNVRNMNGGTPLHVAASQAQPEGAKILIGYGASVNDGRSKDGATPLHIAALKGRKPGHIEVAKILLENGADQSITMNNGATPLSMATYRGNTKIIELLQTHRQKPAAGGVSPDREKVEPDNRRSGSGSRSRWSQGQAGAGIRGRFGGHQGRDRSKMLERFDTNGDGILDDNERAAMREMIKSRFTGRQGGAASAGRTAGSNKAGGGGASDSQLLKKLEAKMGKPLTAIQQSEILKTFQTNIEPMARAKEKFAHVVSDLTGVPVEQLREWMPPPYGLNRQYKKDMIPKIEEYIGRSITGEEMETIKQAGQDKNEALYQGKDAIVEAVSRITGLPAEEIEALLPKYDGAN